jgi:trimeric autotransporter adhesin
MNEFLAFDDADWELASAYLDNEATSAERAQVEASPALLGLVADLRSVQSSVVAQPPTSIDRDAMMATALAAMVDESVVGPVVGSGRLGGELEPPRAAARVTSITAARSRRAQFWRAPMLLAAALLTVMGIGFALRSGSHNDSQKTSSGAATTASAAASASQDQSTGVNAAPSVEATAPATTAAPAALPARTAEATTAAAAATTAAPAATTAAAATTAVAASATTAAPAAASPTTVAPTPSSPATTAASPPLPTLTLRELGDLVVASAANPAAQLTLICPDPRGVPRLSVQILWNGESAIAFIDQISRTLVVLAVNGCTPLANIPIKDLAQS